MMFTAAHDWSGPSSDPNDRQFGDVIEPTTIDAAHEYDAVLISEPYDGAVIGRPGARDGPEALRTTLAATKAHHLANGPVAGVGDLGTVELPTGKSVETVQEIAAEAAEAVHDVDSFPVFLGGDNSLTYPNATPLLERGSLGVISFDAHFDCREVRGQPSSGTPYRQLHEDGLDAFAVVGARGFENSTTYADYVTARGGTVISAASVGDDPAAAVDAALAAMDGVDAIYVSVDLDVLDAAAAPGVSAPTPGGLTTRELYRLLREVLAADRVAGFEIVECAPPLDAENATVNAGSRAVAHALDVVTEIEPDGAGVVDHRRTGGDKA